ncbi:hypothetical protein HMPREF1705_04739 [Acetomicrobium hydrogeniformans ATCC BAA-1850]|uniref:Uncharacterized protein n=1 Tax=Acetomicrobium hydrogeniformans ATCC BAA-1850 TaxID=592015 RepID=A0A0T5X8P9_9BACT|nr:hypothetical protein HMPREF1705_04739 [Acetomicrobium hydrogeniformans ATCC BAA-1850]
MQHVQYKYRFLKRSLLTNDISLCLKQDILPETVIIFQIYCLTHG